jgi:hypothetical protein
MPIGSHIIPRFYLEQFSTPSGRKNSPGRIWVYERGRQPHQRATSVQGRENGYFGYRRRDGSLDESLEVKLASLETECADTLTCGRSDLFDWSLTGHRNRLASYAALLFSRATQRREMSDKNWSSIQERFAAAINDDSYINDLAKHYGARLNRPVAATQIREDLKRIAGKMNTGSGHKNIFLQDLLTNTRLIQNMLIEKPWQLWKTSPECEFVTSDNPLVTFLRLPNGELHPGYGFRVEGVVAAFPLAPDACMGMGVHGPESVVLREDIVMKINEIIVRLCARFVYSRTRSDHVNELVQGQAGAAKYGVSAFLNTRQNKINVQDFMRKRLGID